MCFLSLIISISKQIIPFCEWKEIEFQHQMKWSKKHHISLMWLCYCFDWLWKKNCPFSGRLQLCSILIVLTGRYDVVLIVSFLFSSLETAFISYTHKKNWISDLCKKTTNFACQFWIVSLTTVSSASTPSVGNWRSTQLTGSFVVDWTALKVVSWLWLTSRFFCESFVSVFAVFGSNLFNEYEFPIDS